MANVSLHIDTLALRKYTNVLRAMHKSALPIAVRTALNSAAFDVKKNTMPEQAHKKFVNRSPNFFRANSKVETAKGFDMPNMKSVVGFMPGNAEKEAGQATKNLAKQEDSGVIGGRAMIPLNEARQGGTNKGLVQSKNRIKRIRAKKIVDSKKSGAKTDKGKYFSSVWHAGKGGHVIGNVMTNKGSKFLLRINSVTRNALGNTVVNSTPLYAVKKGRKVAVRRTNFMKIASNKSAAKIEKFYEVEALKQINKLR